MHATAFRRYLEECDVDGVLALHALEMPHLPPPATRAEALVSIHHARTQAEWMRLTARYYSHRWLLDHGYPSGLPDSLRPLAERIYPRVVSAVGISLQTNSEIVQPIIGEVRGAMEHAVLEAQGDGKLNDDAHVRRRMLEAKDKTTRLLIGR